jgi:tRNA threonylcarbamoyladenosine biosynthesis protein TsaE
MIHITTKTPQETMAVARRFCLSGQLGTGKTTFVKGLAGGLGIDPADVNSPTFVLLNVYQGQLPLYHFDFYRMERAEDIARLGYEEFLFGEGVAVVEWAERLGVLMPAEHLKIRITHKGDQERRLQVSARGSRYQKFLKDIP